MNFNPRSREGSDLKATNIEILGIISIRAPARGATIRENCSEFEIHISIRAPARGATIFTGLGIVSDVISIRAPARGATCDTRLR